jgi:ankyrin repeat protein
MFKNTCHHKKLSLSMAFRGEGMKIRTNRHAHDSTRFSSIKRAIASAALGVLLAGPAMSGCKKAHVEEATVFSDDAVALQTLISKGADVNTRNEIGETPLLRAVYNGNAKIVEVLVTGGAEKNSKDKNGWTALMWAVNDGRDGIAKFLIESGADVNAKDGDSRTVLMRAASGGRRGMVELLLAEGADPNAADAFGMTPLKCATVGFTDANHQEIAKILRKSGARE